MSPVMKALQLAEQAQASLAALARLDTLPLPEALMWHIENGEGLSSEVFFYLRERFRAYQENPQPELHRVHNFKPRP